MALLVTLLISSSISGCSDGNELTGVVQKVEWQEGKILFFLGPSADSPFSSIEPAVLWDQKAKLQARDPIMRRLLGADFVGRKVRISGQIQRDTHNRQFIHVSKREQIEIL